MLALLCCGPVRQLAAQDELATLERYNLRVGENSDGVAATLRDKYFGNGTARAVLSYIDTAPRNNPSKETGRLSLLVTRHVPRGTITFALLCFEVDVRGYDAADTEIYTQTLPGFTFGDSKSGRYAKTLREIPLTVARIEVTFRGNYE